MSDKIAITPEPHYWAVIFSRLKTKTQEGYGETPGQMVELAKKQKGFWKLIALMTKTPALALPIHIGKVKKISRFENGNGP